VSACADAVLIRAKSEYLTLNRAELTAGLLLATRNFPQTLSNTAWFNCDPLIFGV
jgi:hypothetical protein